MTETSDVAPQASPLEWGYLAALLLYTVTLFYGVGPPSEGMAQHWYEPRAFLFDVPGIAELLVTPGRALASLCLPAVLLLGMVFRCGHSAVARTIALSCLAAAPLFVFYGTVAPFVWEFFRWRGSAVLWMLAISLGLSMGAPFLARSWLRLGWPLRVAVYLPFLLISLAFLRNATGTDESLPFAISPWPVVPVFGIEVGALLVCVSLVGVALGVLGLAVYRAGTTAGLALAAVGGLGAPTLLLFVGGQFEMFPFSVGPGTLGFVAFVCAVSIAAAGTLGAKAGAPVLRSRALATAVGAALIGIPLVGGQAIARYDYHLTREVHARTIIDALDAYYAKEELYPDELTELIEGEYLDEVPEPAIGFGFLYDGAFRYQNFGTSFILEFPAPRWVECAYTPPYDDEYEDEEEEDAGVEDELWDDESLGEAWSCPSKPPELW